MACLGIRGHLATSSPTLRVLLLRGTTLTSAMTCPFILGIGFQHGILDIRKVSVLLSSVTQRFDLRSYLIRRIDGSAVLHSICAYVENGVNRQFDSNSASSGAERCPAYDGSSIGVVIYALKWKG